MEPPLTGQSVPGPKITNSENTRSGMSKIGRCLCFRLRHGSRVGEQRAMTCLAAPVKPGQEKDGPQRQPEFGVKKSCFLASLTESLDSLQFLNASDIEKAWDMYIHSNQRKVVFLLFYSRFYPNCSMSFESIISRIVSFLGWFQIEHFLHTTNCNRFPIQSILRSFPIELFQYSIVIFTTWFSL